MAEEQAGPTPVAKSLIDLDLALGYEMPPVESSYSAKDAALYALGVGAANDPSDGDDLRHVYEMHADGFQTLPTFGVIPALNSLLDSIKAGKQAPGLRYGLERILHGEQYLEIRRPMPESATLTHRARIKDIFDKGRHAVVVTEIKTYDAHGSELSLNEVSTFIRGAGGFGGERGPTGDVNVPPDRAPDAVITEKVPANQALLYRLSGDWNPLHIDPAFARKFGFRKPILHGLCTLGYAGRHVVKAFAPNGDTRYFKSIRVRFADVVYPGETIATEMWKESETRIVFVTKVTERGKAAISNAAIEFYEAVPKPESEESES